jgi:hypothetical protein
MPPDPFSTNSTLPEEGEDEEAVAKSLIGKPGYYEEFPAIQPEEGNEGEGDVESE